MNTATATPLLAIGIPIALALLARVVTRKQPSFKQPKQSHKSLQLNHSLGSMELESSLYEPEIPFRDRLENSLRYERDCITYPYGELACRTGYLASPESRLLRGFMGFASSK